MVVLTRRKIEQPDIYSDETVFDSIPRVSTGGVIPPAAATNPPSMSGRSNTADNLFSFRPSVFGNGGNAPTTAAAVTGGVSENTAVTAASTYRTTSFITNDDSSVNDVSNFSLASNDTTMSNVAPTVVSEAGNSQVSLSLEVILYFCAHFFRPKGTIGLLLYHLPLKKPSQYQKGLSRKRMR